MLGEQWDTREGQKVPEPGDIALKNQAVKLKAAVLYADLGRSTHMVKDNPAWFAAEIYKTYLYCAARVIRANSGTITAYDGDRIMAVFIGTRKNSNAAKTALRINYAVRKIIQPRLTSRYPNRPFALKQRVGVDTSDLYVARTGIRGSNDLVWVGNAANNAAKMAAQPTDYPSYISASVYKAMTDASRLDGITKGNMWIDLGESALGYQIYGSRWTFTL